MDDLVKRLHALSRYAHDDRSIGDEAADEIGRLTAERDSLSLAYKTSEDDVFNLTQKVIPNLRAERDVAIDALRELVAERDALLAAVEQRAKALRGGGESPLAGPFYVDRFTDKPPRKMRTGSGAPSICWVCGKQLQRAKGKGLGLFYFNLVRDRANVDHRAHGSPCTPMAIDDGNKVVKESKA